MVDSSAAPASAPVVKILYSYGGKILPRYPDGKLRYSGGETRVLAVKRSVSFSELSSKLADLCGSVVNLRCQLPTEDLDALVTIICDEDLSNLIEEYDRVNGQRSHPLKIRAFLWPLKSKFLPPYTAAPTKIMRSTTGRLVPVVDRCRSPHHITSPVEFPVRFGKLSANPQCMCNFPGTNLILVHHGLH